MVVTMNLVDLDEFDLNPSNWMNLMILMMIIFDFEEIRKRKMISMMDVVGFESNSWILMKIDDFIGFLKIG